MVLNIIEPEGNAFRKIILSGNAPDDTGWLLHHEILEILRSRKGERLLVDITAVQGRSNIVEAISLANRLRGEDHIHSHRIAVVELLQNQTTARNEEVVLANRGIPVRFFFGEEEATKWLVE
jgi:hypothetical protein